ncbi:MAG: hypothetical protein JNM63_06170, partial [Spirochaetia bacterium]|nr:hypothetical protein [Spirochaetia bacterium]
AMVDMAKADLQAMVRMVEGDAASSRQMVAAALIRVEFLKNEVVPKAKQMISPVLSAYATGQVPLISVIEAAGTLWSAQEELVGAEYGLGVAQIKLRRAMGESVK